MQDADDIAMGQSLTRRTDRQVVTRVFMLVQSTRYSTAYQV